jgi:hypothetical protein
MQSNKLVVGVRCIPNVEELLTWIAQSFKKGCRHMRHLLAPRQIWRLFKDVHQRMFSVISKHLVAKHQLSCEPFVPAFSPFTIV